MIYYKVKPQFDNKPLYQIKNGIKKHYDILVANELYTIKELQRLVKNGVQIPFYTIEKVNVPKSKIHWFFGARFEKAN